mmetsp:Transcript_474/g.1808  ORF Transcript_474/g.1808 Transcript_474/m.1808 type:complete len:272 (-) Transcript_474:1274-2089(-)
MRRRLRLGRALARLVGVECQLLPRGHAVALGLAQGLRQERSRRSAARIDEPTLRPGFWIPRAEALHAGEEDALLVALVHPWLEGLPRHTHVRAKVRHAHLVAVALRHDGGHARLRAVAVVHVKVQQGDLAHTRRAVAAQRVRRAARHIVEQAEAVRAVRVVHVRDHALGSRVVTGRARHDEGIGGLAREHCVHRGDGPTHCVQRGLSRLTADGGVRVQVGAPGGHDAVTVARTRARGAQLLYVVPIVHAQHVRERRARRLRPLCAPERGRA